MVLKLVKPSARYLNSVREAVREYKAAPSEFEIHAVSKMIEAEGVDFTDYFKQTEQDAQGLDLKPGYVANTVFWLVDGNKYLGSFDLRHNLTPALENIGGHIAYQIRPSEYKKGYVSAGLQLCLEEAHKMGIEKALLTCKSENKASYAVMCKAMRESGGYEVELYEENGEINKRVWLYTSKEHK